MCFGLGLTKLIFGDGGAGAARKQAKAEAVQNRLSAQAAQQAREAAINQANAAKTAEAMLNKPVAAVDVQVGDQTNDVVDPASGRKRTARSSFQIAAPSSGLSI